LYSLETSSKLYRSNYINKRRRIYF